MAEISDKEPISNEAGPDEQLNRKYFRFNSTEVPARFADNIRSAVVLHNRRYLRVISFLGLLVGGLLIFRRLYFENVPGDAWLHIRYLINFSTLIFLSGLYLLISYISGKKTNRTAFLFQRVYISAVIINYVILTYLDMQLAPDYSAIIAVVLFLSVTLWFDSYAYLGFLIFINMGVLGSYLLGVNETVLASELFIEMVLFSLIGLGLFYSISDGRMRAFTNDLLLRDSIEKLRESSFRDPLTGLFNRRMMNQELDKYLALSARAAWPVSVILLDLDRFKRVNDSLGHMTGDEVLKQAAVLMESVIRESDRAFRFGGEEFVIMLPDTPLSNAEILAGRLVEKFRSEKFLGVPWTITVSMGIVDNTERLLAADLIKLADSRMYSAKETGRDRYVSEGNNEKFDIDEIVIP